MFLAKSTLKTFMSCGILKNQSLSRQTFNSFVACSFTSRASSMKRTRSASKAKSAEIKDDSNNTESETTFEDNEHLSIRTNAVQNNKLNSVPEIVGAHFKAVNNTEINVEPQLKDVKDSNQEPKSKLNFKNLRNRHKNENEEYNPNVLPPKNKPRAVVDLEMMKEEQKQLEDPPLTDWEKQMCSNRLPFLFFDSPCEELAQKLLGKILVRCLENGTILKGRIVETEGYLGIIDKASHSYEHKVTPRNIPMYMPPGTIYVYMTYGMYHCFNISSQESGAHVLIKAVEPLLGIDYMELLRNMQYERNTKEKKIMKNVQHIKQYELCNSPSKICTAFVIDEDSFNNKKIYECSDVWIELDPYIKFTTIVAASPNDKMNDNTRTVWRYYVLGSSSVTCDGSAVLIRAVEPLEGMESMLSQRTSKRSSSTPKKPLKSLKTHELCNGPSKLCMAFQLLKKHSKYSVCSWKGLWIENDNVIEDIKIVNCPRIGIDGYGPEWSSKPLRYYIYGNKAVSKRNKKAESLLELN